MTTKDIAKKSSFKPYMQKGGNGLLIMPCHKFLTFSQKSVMQCISTQKANQHHPQPNHRAKTFLFNETTRIILKCLLKPTPKC